MLDLEPGIHLQKPPCAVLAEQELDGAGAGVAGRSGKLGRRRAERLAQLVVDGRGRRLLDDLLMPALDRAVALAEVDHASVLVGQDLHLDVAGAGDRRSR